MINGLAIRSIVEKRVAAVAVTLFTVAFWLVIATFPGFFLFNPLETKDTLFRFEQLISTFAWAAFAILPMLFSWLRFLNSRSTEPLYLVAAGLWPLSVLAIQITMAVRGFGFYSYLADYPILAFTDIITPLGMIAISKAVFIPKS
jgi:hypothetical protein